MVISYEKNFLFIHVPKTAGTSIRASLSRYAHLPDQFWENRLLERIGIRVNHWGPSRRKRFRYHSTALQLQGNLPGGVFDRLFKFAFVRNPWDLLVSLYSFIPNRPTNRHSTRVAAMSFAAFVDEWTLRPEISQKSFLCDRTGKCLMDYVGRFENLTDDYAEICRRIGITADLGHFNSSRRVDYREMYSPELKSLVASRLAEDIEMFGYEFDGSSGIQSRAA